MEYVVISSGISVSEQHFPVCRKQICFQCTAPSEAALSCASAWHLMTFCAQEMLADFDSEMRKREHEFNLRLDEMRSVVLSHELKVKSNKTRLAS